MLKKGSYKRKREVKEGRYRIGESKWGTRVRGKEEEGKVNTMSG